MMKHLKTIAFALCAVTALTFAAACEEKSDLEKAAEDANSKIEEAAEDADSAIGNAMKDLEKGLDR